MPLMNQGLLTFVTILGVMERLCNFRLVLERKTGKEIPESSRLEFLEKVLANNFALSDAEDNNSSLLNRGGIYSRFTFVENTISNSPKVLRAKFLGVMDSFVLITSLSELHFRFRFILLVQMKKKKDFYDLWQQHKLLKTMEMSVVRPVTYDEWYIHQFQREPTHKIHKIQQ